MLERALEGLFCSHPALLRGVAAVGMHPLPFGHPRSLEGRSHKWPTVEKHFLVDNPVCVCSGMSLHLEVHHKSPFHLHPELELDPKNLRTVSRPYHFLIGHGCNWQKYNKHFDEHAALLRDMVEKLRNTPPEHAARELLMQAGERFGITSMPSF